MPCEISTCHTHYQPKQLTAKGDPTPKEEASNGQQGDGNFVLGYSKYCAGLSIFFTIMGVMAV